MRRAAIDIGTNSFHLVVAEVYDDGRFDVLTTEKETVRLGEGPPGENRQLTAAALDRGIDTLRRFRAIAESHDAEVDAVATSAVREASNGRDFVARARAEAGVEVDVITGVEEARLIHLGVLQALPVFEKQILVVDIGGGSTEMVIGRSGRMLAGRSLMLGHLRLTNRFFPAGEIAAGAIDACRSFVREAMAPAADALGPLGHQVAIGSSGTMTELGDLIRLRESGETASAGLDTVISREGLALVIEELTSWPDPDARTKNVKGLEPRRADVIVAGALLLQQIFDSFAINEMLTSPYALREGVLLDRSWGAVAGTERLADLRTESLQRMVDAFEEDRSHVEHITALALRLFDELSELHGLANLDRELLEAAGLLHNVGMSISHSAHHKHSYYVIRNSDRLVGYTDLEVELIALVARYHRKSDPKSTHLPYQSLAKADRARVSWLSGMLRVAIALNRTRNASVNDLTVSVMERELLVTAEVAESHDASVEIHLANERSTLLAAAAGREVSVRRLGA